VILSKSKTEKQLTSIHLPTTIIKKNVIVLSGYSKLREIVNENTGLITITNFIGSKGIQMQGIDSDTFISD